MQFELIMIFWDPKKEDHVTYTHPGALDTAGVKQTVQKLLEAWGKRGLRLADTIILPCLPLI